MNRRQKMKKLKGENELMRNIIKDVPGMWRLYSLWHRPLRGESSHVNIKPYKCCKIMTYDLMRCKDGEKILKEEIARCLAESIKAEIIYRFDEKGYPGPILEGTIWIGHQEAKHGWETEK